MEVLFLVLIHGLQRGRITCQPLSVFHRKVFSMKAETLSGVFVSTPSKSYLFSICIPVYTLPIE